LARVRPGTGRNRPRKLLTKSGQTQIRDRIWGEPVRRIGLTAGVLVLGAIILSPVVAAFNFDPLPGDLHFHWGSTVISIPVIYSLCASLDLALLYKVLKG